jgi:thiamine biosynthesis lipoprotein
MESMFVKVATKIFLVFIMPLLLIAGGCNKRSSYITIDATALGTFAQVKCNTTLSPTDIASIINDVDIEAKASMSIFDSNSLLSQINRNETDVVDKHIAYNIALAEQISAISEGAYDITIKPLTDAWGFGRDRRHDTEVNVDSLLEFVGYTKICIEGDHIIKQDPRVQIDLNSIAKGYVVDMIAERLEELAIEDYMVNIGGEVRCKGLNPRGAEWSIGIETPYDGNMSMDSFEKIIYVEDAAVATSGNYRRFYISEDGAKVAHTIDPRTGYSAVSTLLSATVVAEDCATADAAATMFMTLGDSANALSVAQRCEAEHGWRYYFIFADGEGYRVECSKEFKE